MDKTNRHKNRIRCLICLFQKSPNIHLKRPTHSQLNWEILLCDVIPDGKTEWTAQFWQAIAQASELSFSVVFHTQNCAVHSGNPTFSSVYLPTPRWHHLNAQPFLAIHSADEHRVICTLRICKVYCFPTATMVSQKGLIWTQLSLLQIVLNQSDTYLLTPWCRVLLEKLTGLQLVKKFPAFYGTRRFITAFTSARHLSLSWSSPIQSTCPQPTSWRSVLILSTHLRLGLPSGLFPSGFPTRNLYAPLSSPIIKVTLTC